jgi:hypothetical protein
MRSKSATSAGLGPETSQGVSRSLQWSSSSTGSSNGLDVGIEHKGRDYRPAGRDCSSVEANGAAALQSASAPRHTNGETTHVGHRAATHEIAAVTVGYLQEIAEKIDRLLLDLSPGTLTHLTILVVRRFSKWPVDQPLADSPYTLLLRGYLRDRNLRSFDEDKRVDPTLGVYEGPSHRHPSTGARPVQ